MMMDCSKGKLLEGLESVFHSVFVPSLDACEVNKFIICNILLYHLTLIKVIYFIYCKNVTVFNNVRYTLLCEEIHGVPKGYFKLFLLFLYLVLN